jgi:hypothetical protein
MVGTTKRAQETQPSTGSLKHKKGIKMAKEKEKTVEDEVIELRNFKSLLNLKHKLLKEKQEQVSKLQIEMSVLSHEIVELSKDV